MKNFLLILGMLSFLASCQKEAIPKPDNLIEKEKMTDILYDLAVLQAIRSLNIQVLDTNRINPHIYVYKKYKIDSLQFANSNKYYAASDIKEYEKMYEEVNDRLVKNKTLADTLVKKEIDAKKMKMQIDTVSKLSKRKKMELKIE